VICDICSSDNAKSSFFRKKTLRELGLIFSVCDSERESDSDILGHETQVGSPCDCAVRCHSKVIVIQYDTRADIS